MFSRPTLDVHVSGSHHAFWRFWTSLRQSRVSYPAPQASVDSPPESQRLPPITDTTAENTSTVNKRRALQSSMFATAARLPLEALPRGSFPRWLQTPRLALHHVIELWLIVPTAGSGETVLSVHQEWTAANHAHRASLPV